MGEIFPLLIQELMAPIASQGKPRRIALHARYIGPVSLKSKGKAAAFHVIWRTLKRDDFHMNRLSSRFSSLFGHDLRANAMRLSRGKTLRTYPDHALASQQ